MWMKALRWSRKTIKPLSQRSALPAPLVGEPLAVWFSFAEQNLAIQKYKKDIERKWKNTI